ncbi:GDP-mannose 4,6-dehydratase [Gammaproteobacteria bacterium]|nr:GDP-mannose 4,6-dehydratase [Gammaproteobacteria bacterium]
MKKSKVALITGITGQDGSYLAELLLEKDYEVHGVKRRTSSKNIMRLEHLFDKSSGLEGSKNFTLYHGDLTDGSSLTRIMNQVKPDEVYNLAAQSHVQVSFEEPEYTANADAIGVLRLLEIMRNLPNPPKLYQASTSELYGGLSGKSLNEETPFNPRSPYAAAKHYAFQVCKIYREAYGLFACNGILFNHESPRRGENFVTRKITTGIASIFQGDQEKISLGNLDSIRDWGHARDYVKAQWMMLQQDEPNDFVIATGEAITVREFIKICFESVGVVIEFSGKGLKEVGAVSAFIEYDKELFPIKKKLNIGDIVIEVDENFFRPLEVDHLLGDATKARKILGWSPETSVTELAQEMLFSDLNNY